MLKNTMSLLLPAKLLKLRDDELALESPRDEHGAVGDCCTKLVEVELNRGQSIFSKHLLPPLMEDGSPAKVQL